MSGRAYITWVSKPKLKKIVTIIEDLDTFQENVLQKKNEGSTGLKDYKQLQVGEHFQNKPTTRAFNLTVEEAVAADDVVAGIILINSDNAYVLFDSGATKSLLSKNLQISCNYSVKI